MNVLLVDPDYKSRFAPLGLMKLSAMYKSQGHTVTFVKGRKDLHKDLPQTFDVVCITSLFTYFYKETINTILYYKKHQPRAEIRVGGIFASIMPEYIERYTGIAPHIGLLPEAEHHKPDQSIVEDFYKKSTKTDSGCKAYYNGDYDYTSLVFTSRGCVRKCKFCVVPKIEGPLTVVPDWEKQVDPLKPTITFMDNNWFAKPPNIIDEDIEKIYHLLKDKTNSIKSVDFNQALDARLFTEDIAKKLAKIRITPLRFAFDNKSEDGHVQKAIAVARNYGLMHSKRDWDAKHSNSSIYTLFNFKDDPEFFYYRIREITKAGGASSPLRYIPIDSVNKHYLSPKWTELQIQNIKTICTKMFSRIGLITPTTQQEFEAAFGKNYEQFIKIISLKSTGKQVKQKSINKKISRMRESKKVTSMAKAEV